MKKLIQPLAALALIASINTASAVEPVTLSEAEMDNVTAAGFFFADNDATSYAWGFVAAATQDTSSSDVWKNVWFSPYTNTYSAGTSSAAAD